MKKLSRFISLFVSLLFVFPMLLTFTLVSADDGVDVINVYSCEDYIDKDILEEFNNSHNNIKVNYCTLATPEEMYNELTRNPAGVDLVCPSEYMIMKMMEEDLIKPFSTPQNMIDYGSPYISNVFKGLKVNVNGTETPILSSDSLTTYAVGYMWGTMGYVYNMDEFDVEEFSNWDAILYNEKCNGKTTIKDSIRDTYIMAVGAVYKDELLALDKDSLTYNEELTDIFNRTDDDTIAKVEEYLQKVRVNLYGFEVDSGKDDILQGKITVNFAWSGDAVYAMDCGDEVDVPLGYAVPEEGSNVWFDGFVMSKKTKHESACIEFLNFLASPSIAVRNMEYTGYTSVVAGDYPFEVLRYELDEDEEKITDENDNYITYYDSYDSMYDWLVDYYELETEPTEGYEEIDLSYFFGGTETGDYKVYSEEMGRQLYAQYSDWETIKRCAVMDNFSKETLDSIGAMWNRVKLTTLSTTAIVLIVAMFLILVIITIMYKHKDKIDFSFVSFLFERKKKKKYKLVKQEIVR